MLEPRLTLQRLAGAGRGEAVHELDGPWCPVAGEVAPGVLSELVDGRLAVGFQDDDGTVLYDGVRQSPARLDVGTAVVHLGGVRFPITGPVRYTMTADAVVALLARARTSTIVPVHYEGWSHFQQDRSSIERVFATADLSDRVRWATPGTPMLIDC